MKICYIADGRSIHTQRWVHYFAQKGHEIHLITYDPMDRIIPGVTEYVLTSPLNNLYLDFFPRQRQINKLIREINPDLIHAHFIAKYGFHLPGLGFHPAVISAWGDDVLILPQKSRLLWYYTKKALAAADLVYAVSRNIQKSIIGDFGIPEMKVRYLPFGIDTDLFAPEPLRGSRKHETIEVFSNRGFFPVYDNETLVVGFEQASKKNPRLRLTLKGEGPEENSIRALVNSLGLRDTISFRKKTDYSEVPGDYRNADIFITTSLSDGTPVSVLEAMASGLPCIATSVGGIPEWIEDKVTGLLVKPGSPDQVAKALLTLASDPSLREQLGTSARDMVVLKGQWKNLMARAEKDYQELTKTNKQDKS